VTDLRAVAPVRALRDRVLSWPTWAVLLGFYLLTRVAVALVIQASAVCCQNPAGVGILDPGYLDMVGIWDGTWYHRIADTGYPSTLPYDPVSDEVTFSAWAFYPAFPMVLRLLGGMGVPFLLAASVVNVAAGGASVLLVWRLLSARAGDCVLHRRMALLATMLWCLYPATAVLQIAYSEALGMALLAAFLCLLLQRRYLWCAVVVLLLGFTRAVAPPLAVVVLAHLVLRWRSEAAAGSRQPLAGQRASAVVMMAATGLSAVAWPLVVGLVTGNIEGFFLTQAAWGQKPGEGPFVAWVLWSWGALGIAGVLLLLAVVASYVSLVVGRHGSWLAAEVRVWALAYPLFLLAVVRPITSMWRFLMLDFPVAAIVVSMTVRGADGQRVTPGWPRRLVLVTIALAVGIIAWTVVLLTDTPWSDSPP
jgi:MFS family permease